MQFDDANETARRALYPLIIASQTIPTTALAPLFVLWFGYSIWGKVLVTVLITFFPITITVFDGFQSVKTEMEELLFTFGASPAQIFWKLKVPAVLPYFFSAIKMAVPLSIIGAAIGEWLGAQNGLGYFSRRMMTQLDGAGVFGTDPAAICGSHDLCMAGNFTGKEDDTVEKRFIKNK